MGGDAALRSAVLFAATAAGGAATTKPVPQPKRLSDTETALRRIINPDFDHVETNEAVRALDRLTSRMERIETFIDSITLAGGPFPDLDGHNIVRTARAAIEPDSAVESSVMTTTTQTLTRERILEIRDQMVRHKTTGTSWDEEVELCDLALEALEAKSESIHHPPAPKEKAEL